MNLLKFTDSDTGYVTELLNKEFGAGYISEKEVIKYNHDSLIVCDLSEPVGILRFTDSEIEIVCFEDGVDNVDFIRNVFKHAIQNTNGNLIYKAWKKRGSEKAEFEDVLSSLGFVKHVEINNAFVESTVNSTLNYPICGDICYCSEVVFVLCRD